MSHHWCWTTKNVSAKFSRDNDQIFALNYENLCDSDYLSRLFSSDVSGEQDQSQLNVWAITADLPEDVLLFGEAHKLAHNFMYHKSLYDDNSSVRCLDSHSEIVVRQIKVFEHIGKLVVEKCGNVVTSKSIKPGICSVEKTNSASRGYILPQALSCALRIAERRSSIGLKQSTVTSLLSLIAQFFQFSVSSNVPASHFLSHVHSQTLRMILCNGVRFGTNCSDKNVPHPEDILESLRMALTCAYGLLKLGLCTGSSPDTLLGLTQLLAVSLCAEERQLELDEELYSVDAEFTLQEKLRMKAKLEDARVNKKKQLPHHSHGPAVLDEGSDADLPLRDESDSYEVKLNTMKSWGDKHPSHISAVSSVPSKLHIVKSSHSSNRPGHGPSHFDTDLGLDGLTPCSTPPGSSGMSNAYPVSTWRASSDPLVKKAIHASGSKDIPASVGGKLSSRFGQQQTVDEVHSHTQQRLRSGLDCIQNVPKDILDTVVTNCTSKGPFSPNGAVIAGSLSPYAEGNSEVWTCGQNSYGELGHGDANLRRSFARVQFFDSQKISCIGAGNEHSIFVSQQGRAFVCGYNDNGQCGMGSTQQVRHPCLIPFLEGEDIANVFVHNGCEHTLVTTRDGKMYSFGYNYRGQLGLGSTNSEPIPRPVKGLMSRKVSLAACSYHHTIVVCTDGAVFSFGRNDCGQLGHGDTIDKKQPQLIPGLESQKVTSVSCGQFHSMIVTSSGCVLASGKNDYGQLGLEGSECVKNFTSLGSSPSDLDSAVQVCCGYYHTIVLSHSGLVYGFGRNDYGQLGLGHSQPRMYGVHTNTYLRDKNVVSIAAGCYHSIAVTTNSMLYVFGRNNHGQLGTGDIDERHVPHPVDDFVGKKVVQIAAGFYHTIVLLSRSGLPSSDDITEDVDNNLYLSDCREPDDIAAGENTSSDRSASIAPQSSLDGREMGQLTQTLDKEQDAEKQDRESPVQRPANRVLSIQDLQDSMTPSGGTVEVKELFIFLIRHLESVTPRVEVSVPSDGGRTQASMWSNESENASSAPSKCATLHIKTMTILLQVTRQFVVGSLAINLPFSQEETLAIMSTIVRVVESYFCSCGGPSLASAYGLDNSTFEDEIDYAALLLQQAPMFPLLSSKDIISRIVSLHHAQFSSCEGEDCNNDSGNFVVNELATAVRDLRKELLCVYFLLPDTSQGRSLVVVKQAASCVARHFETLFWSTNERCRFVTFLAETVTEGSNSGDEFYDISFSSLAGDNPVDSIDYSRYVRLFTRVCFKYRSIGEVVQLFQTSVQQGLQIYSHLLNVYAHISKARLEYKLHDRNQDCFNELSHWLNNLEHCCTHFTKCAIPIIFENRNAGETYDTHIHSLGERIIRSLFYAAESVVDYLNSHPITEDTRDTLRNGTVLSSILPTFMLYALSNTDLSDRVFDLSDPVNNLLLKLQEFVQNSDSERDNYSPARKRLKDDSSGYLSPSCRINDSASPLKKEIVQTNWWNRLLKLTIVLSAKLSSILLGKESYKSGASNIEYGSFWQYWAGPDNMTQHLDLISQCCPPVESDENNVLRHGEYESNPTYRAVLVAAKASKCIDIVYGIEACIAASIRMLCSEWTGTVFLRDEVFFKGMWSGIADIVKYVISKRTELVMKAKGQSWRDIFSLLSRVVYGCHKILNTCVSKTSVAPLPLSVSARGRLRPALRRTILVVMCINRWKSCHQFKIKKRMGYVLRIFKSVVTESALCLNTISVALVESSWRSMIERMIGVKENFERQTAGILSIGQLLSRSKKQPSLQIDVVSIISMMWKHRLFRLIEIEKVIGDDPSSTIGTSVSTVSRKNAVQFLIDTIQDSVKSFCSAICDGSSLPYQNSEINLFCFNMKFLQLIVIDRFDAVSSSSILSTFVCLKDTLVFVDDKLVEFQVSDERGGGAAKRATNRERASHLRRAACVIVSFMQAVAVRSTECDDCNSSFVYNLLLDANCSLLHQFQRSRRVVAMAECNNMSFANENKDSAMARSGKDSSAQRRRCQELIVNPMQFGRTQEGFVVQGEKLLSNLKGIDFTLAFWVFITKKTTARYNFLVGKVSHNDAWPLIAIRGSDMKLEVIYGRANEFERLTSQSSIPMYSWVHVAAVVESRKVKLFVNGAMDCQVTTAGNARAILYPVIIGSCPSGVRTRVDYIREGFDGLLASLKYYTRALSPIHVRVVYDQGPPEAHDARERLAYQLLAACMSLVTKINCYKAVANCAKVLSSMHCLFLSDSNRLRYGALKVMEKILLLDVVEDIELSTHDGMDRTSSLNESSTIMNVSCLPEHSTFREKFVLYIIRLIGVCWVPSSALRDSSSTARRNVDADNDSKTHHKERLLHFLSFCPAFVIVKTNQDFEPSSGIDGVHGAGAIEVPVAREDLVGELSQNLVRFLRHLSTVPSWNAAISAVLYRCLCKCRVAIEIRSEWTDLVVTDMLGTAVFVGDFPVRPYIGGDVKSRYCRFPSKVLSIDKTTNQATLLTKSSISCRQQLISMKTTELSGYDSEVDNLILRNHVTHSMLDLMDSLCGYVSIALSDFLAINCPDHEFMRNYVYKYCRPVEIFIYHQLTRRLARSSDLTVVDMRAHSNLFSAVLQHCARAVQWSSSNVNRGGCDRSVTEQQLPSLWMKSIAYMTTMPDKITQSEFPPDDAEIVWADFVTRQMGIVTESIQPSQKSLLKTGLLAELIYCQSTNVPPSNISSRDDFICTETSGQSVCQDGIAERIPEFPFQLVLELRDSIIYHTRTLCTSHKMDISTYSSLQFPAKVMLWHGISHEQSFRKNFELNTLCENFSTHLYHSHGSELTHSLVHSIRYVAASFLQSSSLNSSRSSSILESTDLFSRYLQSAFVWLRLHEHTEEEPDVCSSFLKLLLPILSSIENSAVELHVMSLCVLAVQRIIVRLMAGWSPTADIIHLCKSNTFNLLWSRAQEHLMRERGHAVYNATTAAQQLVCLASGFAIIQRNCSRNCTINVNKDSRGSSNVHSMTPRTPRVPQITVNVPVLPFPSIIHCGFHSVEIDVSTAVDQYPELENGPVLVEIAIRVVGDSGDSNEENSSYETVYYGISSRITHTGLCSNSSFSTRYRLIIDSIPGPWSGHVDFRTKTSSSPFTFDPLRCGADIIISQDGRAASYTGDDNWSTILGNYPFTNGVNSWEVKIVSSSTAYIFVGVASSDVDLNTFLGGCSEGWGFIGEQALYHGREKVKIYGEPFSVGDIVGVVLDFNCGTLSFTRNGKNLGVAFDKIYGELFPAIAFYNVGQEVEIVCDSGRTLCPPVPLPCSPSIVSLDQFSVAHEMLYCLNTRTPFSPRILDIISNHLMSWSSGSVFRRKTVSGSYVFLSHNSALLKQYGLNVGDRVRTQYGIAEIVGTAYGRIWFRTKEKNEVWYFSRQQLVAGRARGLFQRCSYEDAVGNSDAEYQQADGNEKMIQFDTLTLKELLDPQRWSEDIDCALVQFLMKKSSKFGEHDAQRHKNNQLKGIHPGVCTPWDVSCQDICDDFRSIQQQLSRYVIDSVELSHKWGITGPKRKAVLARIGMLRVLNHQLEHILPYFLPTLSSTSSDLASPPKKHCEDYAPVTISIPTVHSDESLQHNSNPCDMNEKSVFFHYPDQTQGGIAWPIYQFSWVGKSTAQEYGLCTALNHFFLCAQARKYIYADLKISHFWKILNSSTAKVSKTDDDYDYPEDLPLVKLNRFKSFRALEAAQQMRVIGEDVMFSSMFCQLWKDLRQHSEDKLRISYTHPMDDGQSRTFKVRFEGEGVDDYGGPYREIFQKLCEELQVQDPSAVALNTTESASSEAFLSGEKIPASCFLPLLHPTSNWIAGEQCEERYKYTFHPASTSAIRLDLFKFLGQLVGIALRSKITLNLPLASFIWKSVVRQPLTEADIASFDAPACSFIQYLANIHHRLCTSADSPDILSSLRQEGEAVLQDVTWAVTFTDGQIVDLIPGGRNKSVVIEELGKYLQLYVEARLGECARAVESFRCGILSVIPESAISLLCWDELEQLVCGSKTIDIERLKANTEYDDDVSPTDAHIVAFWEVLNEFSEEEKGAFLRFVWARPTLPPKDVEFPQKLKIQSAVGDDASSKPDQYLPKAHTCFFSINLPRYSSKSVMAEKLRYAIVHCTEMDADFRVTEPDIAGWSSVPSALHNWSTTGNGE